jgi:hypothetical protein
MIKSGTIVQEIPAHAGKIAQQWRILFAPESS